MWGEVMEEDLYDHNTPFYNHDEALKELMERKAKVRAMLEQDALIREALESGRRKDVDSQRLKRKVIYVYEDDELPSK